MKAVVCAILLGILVAIASGDSALPLEQKAKNTLTPIDSVPTRAQIDDAFNTSQNALQNLTAIATDDQNPSDTGIRLRAIHALAKYCTPTPCTDTDPAHVALKTVVADNQHEVSGARVLLLRAGIETIGVMRVRDDDINLLLPLLDHSSRDIRAATAKALADICGNPPPTITALRFRYSHEPTEQVKLAISEALRILGQCSSNP
jgi:HEAT repeat protein